MPAWIDAIVLAAFRWIAVPLLAIRFPGVGKAMWLVAAEGLAHVLAADDKPAAVEELREKVRECTGVGCPIDTVRERIQP